MNKKATYAIVDLENNGERFWDNLKTAHPELENSLCADEATLVSAEDIETIKSTPGYDDGDARAPHPVEFLSYEDAIDAGWLEEE